MKSIATDRQRFRLWFSAAAVVSATVFAANVAQSQEPKTTPAQDDAELERVGYSTVEKVCSECHGIDDMTHQRRTPKDWSNMVVSMAQRGANATDDQLALVKRYLTRHYGLLPVNTAPAEDFSAVLGLSAKDAAAIVEYRKANGRFTDAAALLKVPGIDKAKIEAQPEALQFQ